MRHFIIVKLKDPKEKAALAGPVQALFEQTLAVPGIHEVKLHLSCSERPNRYDMMIELVMEPEALPRSMTRRSHTCAGSGNTAAA